MRILKNILGTAALLAMISGAASAADIEINVGHVLNDQSSYQEGLVFFADEMAKRTDGAVKVNIFPSAGLGGELRLVQGGTTGTVDAFIVGQPSLEGTVPEFKILSLPYLFESEEQAVDMLNGEFGQKLLDLLPSHNMVGLGWAGVFTRGLPAGKPVEKASDLKGLKVRVMQSPGYITTFEAFGSQSAPIPFGELFMALQTGVVDAADLSPDLVISGQFVNAISHYSLTGIHQLPSIFVMSKAKLDSLPEDIRKTVLEVGREASEVSIKAQHRLMAEGLEQMRAAGITIIEPDVASFKEVSKSVWPQIVAGIADADDYIAMVKAKQAAK
jgi:tripartite ATP-independent transporter DctP family solute receptor